MIGMATHRAIAAVGGALLRLLEDACPRADFPTAEFSLIQAGQIKAAPMKEGVSLLLYRVAINGAGRNRAVRVRQDGTRYRPSLPVDLYYLLTPWAESAFKQHRLLGWAMRTLEDTPILPAGLLNQHGPEHDTFGPTETVEIVTEPITVIDLANVWEALEADWQVSVAYVARLVAIDSDLDLVEGPRVQTRELDVTGGPPS
jgi:hypothetical protein